MWVIAYLLVPIFVNVFEASCHEKSSLAFVIDNTGSMYDDIYQVKVNAAGISKVVFDEKASQIQNMVLVTFNDPATELVTITEDRDIFQQAINSVHVYGGDDCPEMAMTGIIQALDESLPGSFIYVFTDAAATDYRRGREVKNLCQKKQSQIVFVLTGYCDSRESLMYQVYYDIAAACSGLAFEVEKFQVHEILSTIKETIVGNKTVLTTKKIPAYVSTDISFEIDDQTEYAIVTASGLYADLQVSGPWAEQERLTWLINVKTIKLNRPTAGTYTATVRGHSQTSVYVVGRTDFFFTHGFSQQEPKSLMDTTPQPIADAPTHLSISVTDPKHTVAILLVHILDMDENIINSIPLKQVSRDFYTTSTAFRAPSERFKIAVIGKDLRTGRTIRRIAKMPITPQDPPKVVPKSLKPNVTITEGVVTLVDYGKTTKLTCKVTAYPEPIIEWVNVKDSRTVLASQSFPVEPPYKYISYLTLNEVSENGTYTCRAKNDAGSSATSINVIVGDPFLVKYAIKDTTEIEYGRTGSLFCDITASVPMHITWSYVEKNTGIRRIISASNDKFSISRGGTVFTINNMTPDMTGIYYCQATLDKDASKKSVHHTQVKISGLAVAKVTGEKSKTVIEGESVDISCRVTGVPKPTITWQYKADDTNEFGNKEFQNIVGIGSKDVLQLSNVNIYHAGSYKCIAHNELGNSEHTTTLIVQVPPKIVSSTTKVYKGIEGQDAVLEIPCEVTGLPNPTITWSVNGVTLSENFKYSMNKGTLVIRNPKVSDSHMYKCEANNDAGTTYAVFQADILQAPKITGEISVTVRFGEVLDIVCKITKGVPRPTLTWSFKAKDSSEFVLLNESAETMRISKADRSLTGTYKCVASNVIGNDEHLTSVLVEFAPLILSNPSTIIEGIEGDIALVVPCKVIGEPKPSVTWKMNGVNEDVILTNPRYLINDDALIIKSPTKNDSRSYTCKAKNYLGVERATFTTEVRENLDEFGPTQIINIKQGDSTNLECVSRPDSTHSIRWFIEGVDTGIKGNSYHLSNVDVSMDGNYTCRVSSLNGAETKTYVVVIGFAPRFWMSQEDNIYDFTGNEDDELSCGVDAKPVPDITWTYNGKVLRDVKSTDLSELSWGNYSCNVTNVHGSVQRSFEVVSYLCLISRQPRNIRTMPLILTPSREWPVMEATKNYLQIKPEQELVLSCPNSKNIPNSFEKLPGLNEITAVCNKQNIFTVDGNPFKVTDLHCAKEIEFVIENKHTKCLTDTSELIRIGYEANRFLETFEVCFDNSEKVPLYARVIMSKTNVGLGTVYPWYKYPGFVNGNEAVYTCKDQSSRCCYSKRQLVNASDVSDGPAQRSTFVDHLNAVPYWRPCDIKESPWDDMEEMVKLRLDVFDQFVVWSGTHTLERKNGGVVPRYLWKVVRLDEDEATAIIYINGDSPSQADIMCKNICPDKYGVPWFTKSNKYIYCCELNDFLEAFDLSGHTIGESLEAALEKIAPRKF